MVHFGVVRVREGVVDALAPVIMVPGSGLRCVVLENCEGTREGDCVVKGRIGGSVGEVIGVIDAVEMVEYAEDVHG